MDIQRSILMALVLTFWLQSFCGCSAELAPAMQLVVTTKDIVAQSWTHVANAKNAKIGDLVANLHYLEKQILNVDKIVKNTNIMVYDLVSQLKRNTMLDLRLKELVVLVRQINSAKKRLDAYMRSSEPAEQLTVKNFAKWCVSQNFDSISSMLERISILTTSVSEKSSVNLGVHTILFNLIEKSENYMCEMQQSPHQIFYNMYSTILLMEIKGYTMMQFSWMFLKIYGLGKFTLETKEAKERYEERTNTIIASCKNIIRQANRYVRRCEPDKHIEGETFVTITRLLQGYVENEVNMNVDSSCRRNCAYYPLAKYQSCYTEKFCTKQKPCKGKIIGCKFVESDMTIYQSGKNSTRRYDWIKFKSGKTYGKYKHRSKSSSNVESSWVQWFWDCSYCVCICDQSGRDSDRYFSLKESLSNVEMNKVITGIRFTKVKRIIYIQICEGTLMSGGRINSKSVAWKQIQPMNLKYANKGIDYHKLTYEKRAIDLDDLEGPKGHVMTGLRFQILEGHLHLQIRTTMFDFNNGTLRIETHSWINNKSTRKSMCKPRQELMLENLDIPVEARMASQPKSTKNQYLKFTHSDFEKDAAQTTVPYLDAQPVITRIPVPLSGAGIFYKDSPGYGGFIAPNIHTYDFSYHINDSL